MTTYLIATAFLIVERGVDRGVVLGVPSFILFTPCCRGDDLFLFRFLPPRGVFVAFLTDTGFTGAGDLAGLGDTIGDTATDGVLALDLADAGVDTIGDLNRSAMPVKLTSTTLLLFLLLGVAFLPLFGVLPLGDFPLDLRLVDLAGDLGVLAGDLAGVFAGDLAGVLAGDLAGVFAGD